MAEDLLQKELERMVWETVLGRLRGENWWDAYGGEIHSGPTGLVREDIVTGETTALSKQELKRAESAVAKMTRFCEKRIRELG